MQRNDIAADPRQNLRREGAGRAVAAGDDGLQAPREAGTRGEIGHIALANIGMKPVAAAAGRIELAGIDDVAQGADLVGSEGHNGRSSPILMPVQPLSLWLAVTIATPSTSSSNWAK